jgi:hypothetical protein
MLHSRLASLIFLLKNATRTCEQLPFHLFGRVFELQNLKEVGFFKKQKSRTGKFSHNNIVLNYFFNITMVNHVTLLKYDVIKFQFFILIDRLFHIKTIKIIIL